MKRSVALFAGGIALCVLVGSSSPSTTQEGGPHPPSGSGSKIAENFDLPPEQERLLERWYSAVKLRDNESFGSLVARVARVQHGTSYEDQRRIPSTERLEVNLSQFECVSFIESSLAVARCVWRDQKDEACFLGELEGLRYRSGELIDYSSRLHYFTDWLIDNDRRRTIQSMTESLGGRPVKRPFYYMTRWVKPILGAADPQTLRLAEAERRLSEADHSVLDRNSAPGRLKGLQAGDLVAFVRPGPGLMIRHAGFAWKQSPDKVQLLHASSHHQRVVLTVRDIANYLLRRPERQGVMIARPIPPERE